MKYSLTIKFSKSKKELSFDSYEEVINYLKNSLTEDNEKYKDFSYLWEYTIKTIKEGGSI